MPETRDATFSNSRINVPPTPGVHTFRIEDASIKEGPSGPYLFLGLVVDEGSPEDERRATDSLSFSVGAAFRMDEFKNAIQLPESGETHLSQLLGMKFRAMVKMEEYNGVERPKLSAYARVASVPATSPNGAAAAGRLPRRGGAKA